MDREEEQDEAVGELIYRVGFSIISSSEIVSLFAPQLELHNEHSTLKLLKTRLNCCIDCTALVWTNPEAYIALSGKRETTNSNTVPGEEVEQRAAGGGGGLSVSFRWFFSASCKNAQHDCATAALQ